MDKRPALTWFHVSLRQKLVPQDLVYELRGLEGLVFVGGRSSNIRFYVE